MTRDEWLDQLDPASLRCWICGWRGFGTALRSLEVHHMERRSHAPESRDHGCNYFVVCSVCHQCDLDTMPHAKQLAFKKKWDPQHYDLENWLRLRDPELKAPERVTQAEVDEFLRRMV